MSTMPELGVYVLLGAFVVVVGLAVIRLAEFWWYFATAVRKNEIEDLRREIRALKEAVCVATPPNSTDPTPRPMQGERDQDSGGERL